MEQHDSMQHCLLAQALICSLMTGSLPFCLVVVNASRIDLPEYGNYDVCGDREEKKSRGRQSPSSGFRKVAS